MSSCAASRPPVPLHTPASTAVRAVERGRRPWRQHQQMEELRTLHDDQVFLRGEALEHGYRDEDLLHARRDGLLVRIRHGAYTFSDVWGVADDAARHSLRAHAVLRSHHAPIALSHTSAAVEHGLRLFRPDLSKIHVLTRGDRLARTTADVVYHRGDYTDGDFALLNGCWTVEPVLAGLQTASLTDVAGGIVVLDSVIDLQKGCLEDINAGFQRIAGHPFSRRLQITVRLVRKGSNSVGESLSRHLMWCQRLPEPELQFEVRDEWGQLVGITDFAWPEHGLLGEFDGMAKYGRLRKEGETPGDAVEREKNREDRLREVTGWLMVRIVWGQLFAPGPTAARIRRQLERGQALRVS